MQEYDIVIVWGGAAGLFCSLFLPETARIAILEKSLKLGTKVLLSWGERCNVSNINILFERDYIGKNIKRLPSIFHAFSQDDMIGFLEEHGIATVVEDNGRVLLKWGKSQQLQSFLVQASLDRGVQHFLGQDIQDVAYDPSQELPFTITTSTDSFMTKKLIVATGGKSFPQVWATDFGYKLAEQFGLDFVDSYRCLCGIETIEDLSSLAGNTLWAELSLWQGDRCLYTRKGSLLFTHWGISWPVVFDATIILWRQEDPTAVTIRLTFGDQYLPQKIMQLFSLDSKHMSTDLHFKAFRPWEEAKVTWWGISLDELTTSFESKKVPGLYFLGELLDITWRSGGYNLQWAWSSAYVCWRDFEL